MPISHAALAQYSKKHPQENTELQTWINSHRILSKSSDPLSTNGKGPDFLQEEDLKKVLGYLPKGTLFDFNSFSRAVRMKQNVEEYQGCKSPERRRPYDRYEIEVQIAGTIMMKNQFTSETSGINPYSEDLLRITEIYEKNLTTFFTHRVAGFETSSLKLEKFHFTKFDKEKSEEIENRTKKEIIEMIFSVVEESAWVDEEYIDRVKDLAKESRKKQFLIELYQEIVDDKFQSEIEEVDI